MGRRLLAFIVFALAATLLPAPAAGAQTVDTYRIEGSGWGHAVGMSQYGARSMAVKGYSADQILATYYTGVTIKTLDQVLAPDHWMRADPTPLWVGLLQNQTVLQFQIVGGPAGLCKANDNEGACPTQTALPGEQWELRALGGGACQFFKLDPATSVYNPVGNPGTCRASIEWADQPSARILLPVIGREYARGTIKVRPVGDGFHVVLEIGIDDYVYGIGEVPSSWPAAALEAQAIAARTYGVRQALRWGSPEDEANFDGGRKALCWCQLVSTVADQNYVGYAKETSEDGHRWVAAVQATAQRVITHPEAPESTVIIAYYSSSSGGHTEGNVEGLGHDEPIPYLVGIPDPWSVDADAQNPFAHWSVDAPASTIATAAGLETVTGVAVTACNDTGSVAEVTVTGTIGGSATTVVMEGRGFRGALGLRSSRFAITPPEGAVSAAFNLDCPAGIPDAGFTDVDPSSVHKPDIDYIAFFGVTTGTTPTTFAPASPVTRWQMALFLTRTASLLGVPLPDGSPQGFGDLEGLPPAAVTAINQLAQLGVTTGTTPTTFDPEAVVSRWQMALFLTRLQEEVGGTLPSPSVGSFADLQGLSSEIVLAIERLVAMGVTNGTSPTTYSPALDVTREQMASFLARLIRLHI